MATFCAVASCRNHRSPGATLINCKHSRFSNLLYFLSDKRICQACHEGVIQLQQPDAVLPELGWDASRTERASLLGMDYFLSNILPALPAGLKMQTLQIIVDKTLAYLSEGLAEDSRSEPWRSLHTRRGSFDAMRSLRAMVDALNLARCGTPLSEVMGMFGQRPNGQEWRARPGLHSWFLRLRQDADVIAAADAYYLGWQIWLQEAHGSDAVASSGIVARRKKTPPSLDAMLAAAAPRARVLLQVYELGKGSKLADAIKSLNSFTQSTLGAGGVFHVAVEVEGVSGGLEWSFGYALRGTGVFAINSKQHPDHQFRETVPVGETSISTAEFGQLISRMQDTWVGEKYQLLRCNCISFCSALCIALGVGPVPSWVDRFPRMGAGTQDFAERVSAAASAASDAISQVMRPVAKPPSPAEVERLDEAPVAFQRASGSYNNVWSPKKEAAGDHGRHGGGWVAGSVSESLRAR